jgi:hypothetical protein
MQEARPENPNRNSNRGILIISGLSGNPQMITRMLSNHAKVESISIRRSGSQHEVSADFIDDISVPENLRELVDEFENYDVRIQGEFPSPVPTLVVMLTPATTRRRRFRGRKAARKPIQYRGERSEALTQVFTPDQSETPAQTTPAPIVIPGPNVAALVRNLRKNEHVAPMFKSFGFIGKILSFTFGTGLPFTISIVQSVSRYVAEISTRRATRFYSGSRRNMSATWKSSLAGITTMMAMVSISIDAIFGTNENDDKSRSKSDDSNSDNESGSS